MGAAGEAGSGGQLDVGRGVASQAIGKLAAAADGTVADGEAFSSVAMRAKLLLGMPARSDHERV